MNLLNELLDATITDDGGFVVINEGFAADQVGRAREIAAMAKDIAKELDAKLEVKFRKELNKQLAAFNVAANTGNVKTIDAKLDQVESTYAKYAEKV